MSCVHKASPNCLSDKTALKIQRPFQRLLCQITALTHLKLDLLISASCGCMEEEKCHCVFV